MLVRHSQINRYHYHDAGDCLSSSSFRPSDRRCSAASTLRSPSPSPCEVLLYFDLFISNHCTKRSHFPPATRSGRPKTLAEQCPRSLASHQRFGRCVLLDQTCTFNVEYRLQQFAGRNIIFTSDALYPIHMRAPHDLVNLYAPRPFLMSAQPLVREKADMCPCARYYAGPRCWGSRLPREGRP